jgi:Spy/CpxP family protein refolding chaperone
MEPRTKSLLRRSLWLALPALLVAVALVPRALAWGRHAHPSSQAELADHMDRGLEHLLDKLDATAAQRQQAKRIAEQRAPTLFALMSEGRALKAKAKAVLLAEQLDEGQLASLRVQIDSVYARTADVTLDGIFDLAGVLTPSQRKQLAERLSRFEH